MPVMAVDKGNNGDGPPKRQVVFKPRTVREVKRFLKDPLAKSSAVIYFADGDSKPFLLGPPGAGISSGAEFKLKKKWKLRKDKLPRIFIITNEDDYAPHVPDLEVPEGEDVPAAKADSEESTVPDGPDDDGTPDEEGP